MSAMIEFEMTAPDLSMVAGKARTAMNKALASWGRTYWRRLAEERLSGRPGLNRRSGNLSRDWVVETSDEAEEMSITVRTQGAANTYAGTQEGINGNPVTLTPKNGKYMWMPLAANLMPNGMARITPRQAIGQGGFVHFGHGNPVFLGKPLVKQGPRSLYLAVVPLFVLLRSVTIPARMGAGQLFQSMLPDLKTSISDAISGAFA